MSIQNMDIEVLIDKSGSMGFNKDCPGGKTRWAYMQETALGIATHCQQYDADGISVVPFAGNHKLHESVTADKVAQVFQEHEPNGSTNTAAVLEARLNAYFERKGKASADAPAKPVCLLVFTDGVPDDQQAVANVIIAATQKMDADEEIAISFIQVGHDADATKFLTWLDDGLVAKGAKFDIVDTVSIADAENLTAAQLIEKAFAD